jgi:rhodanese-related sulfurtransferase
MAGVGYAGDVTSAEAWEMLAAEADAVLVDVRTEPEWRHVGVPRLDDLGKEVVYVSWQFDPDMRQNPEFATELRQKGVATGAKLLLICRSGNRSRSAAQALTVLGFERCYNVADGFEGPPDGEGLRGVIAGWQAAGLPWGQG